IRNSNINIIDKFKFFFGFERNKISELLGISVDSKIRVLSFYLYVGLICLLALFQIYAILNILERLLFVILSLFLSVELLYFLVSKKHKDS
ncbi:TPA: hypothetical protein ACOTG6_003111, partial [Clostridium perfringens]